jgi:hypothetical protein
MKTIYTLSLLLLSTSFALSQCEIDVTNPWFSNFQEEVTISCETDLSTIFPQAFDDCDTLVEIAYYDEVFPGSCPSAMDIVRIYRAFDDSGNSKVELQTIHIIDETPPHLSEIPINYTLSCGDTVNFTTLAVVDNCGPAVLSYEDYSEIVSSCESSLIRVWTAVDACGNTSNTSQTITFIDDQPPLIVGEIYLELQNATDIDSIHVTITDNCSSYSVTYEDVEVSGSNVIRTYTAIDVCGNISTFTQILHIPITLYILEKTVTMCKCVGNDTWLTIHVSPSEVQSLLGMGSYMGKCKIKDYQNQAIPLRMNIEITQDGSIRKSK